MSSALPRGGVAVVHNRGGLSDAIRGDEPGESAELGAGSAEGGATKRGVHEAAGEAGVGDVEAEAVAAGREAGTEAEIAAARGDREPGGEEEILHGRGEELAEENVKSSLSN